jgi:hypothetical protein
MDFYDHPAMVDLQEMSAKGLAKLYLTGVAYNLLTLRPEICLLLVIQDETWWERVNVPDSCSIKLTLSETKNQLLKVPIADDEKFFDSLPEKSLINFVPQGIPALVEGVKLAQEILNL